MKPGQVRVTVTVTVVVDGAKASRTGAQQDEHVASGPGRQEAEYRVSQFAAEAARRLAGRALWEAEQAVRSSKETPA